MGPIGHQRIAQRFPVTTTPIRWKVPKRRGLNPRSKSVLAEAAIIEISVMGAAVVAPVKWQALVGTRVEVQWDGEVGTVIVRREVPVPGSTTLAMYGVEYGDNPSLLGQALIERLVVAPAEAAAAREAAEKAAAAAPDAPGPDGPSVWAAPNAWAPETGTR